MARSRFVADGNLNRLADFPPTGKVPVIREIPALLGLDRLNRAGVSLQKKTGAVFPVDQGKSRPVWPQAREPVDKVLFLQSEVAGDEGRLLRADPYEARPPAAGCAALAEIGRRHPKRMNYDL